MKCHKTSTFSGVFFFLFFVFSSVSGKVSFFPEKTILLELKRSVSDPRGILRSWDFGSSDHHCSWFGVSCDSSHRVTSISIRGDDGKRGKSRAFSCSESMGLEFEFYGVGFRRESLVVDGKLEGEISPLIGKLSELRVLSLPYNDLSGGIPGEIWGLEKLEVLDLEGNLLSGKLPDGFSGLRKLRVLNLGSNRIKGEVPFELSKCGDLEVLNLAGNRLNGSVPGFFGMFPKLQGLYLSQNRLTGNVLDQLGSNCQALEHLDLSGNMLVGRIPGSLGNCRKLRTLLLFSNKFNGVIPHELSQLRMAEVLDVSWNNLSGPIPTELGQCVNLAVLVLSNLLNPLPSVEISTDLQNDYNRFEGSIPMEITTLPNLRILWAPRVVLEGKLPSNWGACENLEMVNLAQNHFEGQVYGVFERCKKLHYLDLSSNKLTGELDEKLPVPCMTIFNISGNLMSGPIPRFKDRRCSYLSSDLSQVFNPSFQYKIFFSCQSRLQTNFPLGSSTLTVIHNFSGNKFTGPIQSLPLAPRRLQKQMTYEFLAGGNKLSGSFPESLFGKCNGLNGMILNVSNNKFSGHFPLRIGAMCRSLTFLDASGNGISGSIPESLGDLTSIAFLDLSRNKLQGQIPATMGHLKHLKYLSLANNNLTGSIPNSFGGLRLLEVLDLSSNSLSGNIPQGLAQLRNLSVLMLDNVAVHEKIPSELTNVASLSTVNVSLSKMSRFLLASLAAQSSDQPDSSQSSTASPSEGSSKLSSIEIASITSASAIVLVLLCLVALFLYTRKWMPDSRVRGSESRDIIVFTSIDVPLTFENIVRATGNFSTSKCIGNGGFGATYKAEMDSGVIVAVKRLSVGRFQGIQQFHAEIKTLGRITHPNLVTLVGYHASETEMFLIYNYLPGGNLEKFIKDRSSSATDWKILHKIAMNIAHALAYLHDVCVPRVLHRDVKPSNILLDTNFNAYLSDFGLSRLLGTSETHATTNVAGTFGYLAPEYAMTCRVSDKSDVYSYGVVLLELISDKRPLDPSFSSHGDGFNIVSWASMLLRQGHAKEVFTAGLWNAGPHNDMVEMLHLAVTCTDETLSTRPTMKQVVQRLKRIQPSSVSR
ncbi:hypothetical protein UlMin_041022 [Ulmus minor]